MYRTLGPYVGSSFYKTKKLDWLHSSSALSLTQAGRRVAVVHEGGGVADAAARGQAAKWRETCTANVASLET